MLWVVLGVVLFVLFILALGSQHGTQLPDGVLVEIPNGSRPTHDLRSREYDDDDGTRHRGFVLYRRKGNQRLSWGGIAGETNCRAFNVAGATKYPEALRSPDFNVGREVTLTPEPDNPYDSKALAVWNRAGTLHVGYIPRKATGRWTILNDIKKGEGPRTFVANEGLRSGERVSLRLLCVYPDAPIFVESR